MLKKLLLLSIEVFNVSERSEQWNDEAFKALNNWCGEALTRSCIVTSLLNTNNTIRVPTFLDSKRYYEQYISRDISRYFISLFLHQTSPHGPLFHTLKIFCMNVLMTCTFIMSWLAWGGGRGLGPQRYVRFGQVVMTGGKGDWPWGQLLAGLCTVYAAVWIWRRERAQQKGGGRVRGRRRMWRDRAQ